MTSGTADKETFLNDIFQIVDASVTQALNVDGSVNSAPDPNTVRNYIKLVATTVPTAGTTITLPVIEHVYILANDPASAGPATWKVGTSQVVTPPGASILAHIDGTSIIAVGSSSKLANLSDVDFSTAPTNGQTLVYNAGEGKFVPATPATGGNSGGGGSGGSSGSSLEVSFVAPPAAAQWIPKNFQSYTHLVDYDGPGSGVMLYEDSNAPQYGNVNNIRTAIVPINDAHWSVIARFRRQGPSVKYSNHGIVLRDNATSHSKLIGFSDTKVLWGGLKMSDDNTFDGDEAYTNTQFVTSNWWERITFDGAKTVFSVSVDGHYFVPVMTWAETAAKAGYLPNGATHIGFGFSINNSDNPTILNDLTLLSWQYAALS